MGYLKALDVHVINLCDETSDNFMFGLQFYLYQFNNRTSSTKFNTVPAPGIFVPQARYYFTAP